MHYFKYLLSLIWVFCSFANAADVYVDLGKYGSVYPIQEEGIHELVLREQKNNLSKGDSDLQTKKALDSFLTDLPPVGNVSKTLKNRTYFLDGDIAIPVDLKSKNGDVIVKAGTKINILSKLNNKAFMMFLDGRDEKQVLLFKKIVEKNINNKLNISVTPFLVAGSVPNFVKLTGVSPYYDYQGTIVNYLKIKNVPALAGIDGNKIRIEEIAQ